MSTDPAVERLRALVRIPTVSRTDRAEEDRGVFAAFRAELARLYPRVHAELTHEQVGHALLYRWEGTGTGRPVLLMAHHDVVPADEPGWRHEPFAADLADGRVWGRGTLDDKGMLAAVLEAIESGLATGFRPAVDVYLLSGGDEETYGESAARAVDLLAERGVRPGLVLDEGGAVAADAFPGVAGDVAYVGVAEKGIATMRLIAEKPGGHAATPAPDGATTTLARAILRLEQRPSRARLTPPVIAMLRAIAPRARGLQRRLFSNPERYRSALRLLLASRGAEAAALVRTTRAVTRLRGSAGDNVLAERAVATVNVRILPGSSVAEAADELRAAIADPGVRVEVDRGTDPSPVSPASGPEWELLAGAIGEVFPDAVVAPYVMLQASDARHATRISDTVYRFLPFDLTAAERGTLHARDESIRVETWKRAVRFFEVLLGRI